MEYGSAIGRKTLLVHITGWVNFKCIFLSERRKTLYDLKKTVAMCCVILFYIILLKSTLKKAKVQGGKPISGCQEF